MIEQITELDRTDDTVTVGPERPPEYAAVLERAAIELTDAIREGTPLPDPPPGVTREETSKIAEEVLVRHAIHDLDVLHTYRGGPGLHPESLDD